MAEAQAIRSAAELREHVEGVRPIDGVLLWEKECVRFFPVDWPEEDDNEDDRHSRFNQLFSMKHDYETITHQEAQEMWPVSSQPKLGGIPGSIPMNLNCSH